MNIKRELIEATREANLIAFDLIMPDGVCRDLPLEDLGARMRQIESLTQGLIDQMEIEL